jgi:hypothetical protein
MMCLRSQRHQAVGAQPTCELGEDRQVSVEPNAIEPTDAERE